MSESSRLTITWLGHSTFILKTPGGKRLMLDPWLTDNPACPQEFKRPPKVDLILASHGHADHIGDIVSVARAGNAPVVASFELCQWLERKGLTNCVAMNKGGMVETAGVIVAMTDARHSSGYADEDGHMLYMGEAAGFIVRLEDGVTLYFAGDTSLFGDMRLIGEMYKPHIAFLPIGDRFTMGPDAAAKASELLGVRQVVPMHWGTFPMLTGTPAQLKALLPAGVEMLEMRPGETAE